MNREELIGRLIASGHLNVPDRKSLGQISRNEVFAAVRARLESDGHFPPGAGSQWGVYEGPQIRRSADGRFLGINQRASVYDSRTMAESIQHQFETQDSAVNWYMDAEWGSGIDGIEFT